jgi:hypothetical protein
LEGRRHAEGRRPEAAGTPEWIHPQGAATHDITQLPNTLGASAESQRRNSMGLAASQLFVLYPCASAPSLRSG